MSLLSDVTIISMIYKSKTYLDFVIEGMFKPYIDKGVRCLVVANDPTPEVLAYLTEIGSPDGLNWAHYKDPKPNDYYLNRVYRAWNYGAEMALSKKIVFVNSDMFGAPFWLENLLKHLTPDHIPCSRLVESGKMPSGMHAISNPIFGNSAKAFDREAFSKYASVILENKIFLGGLYMPCAFYRDEFLDAGGYPEGNIYTMGVGAHNSHFLTSGDDHFFHQTMKHKQHVTVYDSIVWHAQEGEMDE